jgi:hypothetical protein
MSRVIPVAGRQARNQENSGPMPPTILGEDEIHALELEAMGGVEGTWDVWRVVENRGVNIELHVDSPHYIGTRTLPDGSTMPNYSPPVKRRIKAACGQEVRVPSCYANVLQHRDEHGCVVSGLAPTQLILIRDGKEVPAPPHPSLVATAKPEGKVAEPGAESRLRRRAQVSTSS